MMIFNHDGLHNNKFADDVIADAHSMRKRINLQLCIVPYSSRNSVLDLFLRARRRR